MMNQTNGGRFVVTAAVVCLLVVLAVGAYAALVVFGGTDTYPAGAFSDLGESFSAAESDRTETSDESVAADTENDQRYSFVWMTDTQTYTRYYPEVLESMCGWLKDNSTQLDIRALFHTGDIIDTYTDVEQWECAQRNFGLVPKNVMSLYLTGNHDVGFTSADYSYYYEYFGDGEKVLPGGNGGIYNNGKAQYILYSTQNCDYIFLGFGWNITEGMVNWAKDLLETYSDRVCILMTHSYLDTDATLTSNGELLYDGIVSTCPNVALVLCGHMHGTAVSVSTFDDDGDGTAERTVTQILADYQGESGGGDGYLQIITVDEQAGVVELTPYSPYLDEYADFNDDNEKLIIDIRDWLKK